MTRQPRALAEDGGTPPLVSVIVPTHDRPDMLEEAVRSILEQSFHDLECIVVDDGGTLPPPSFDDARVTTVRRTVSGGPAAARNAGIDQARGDWIAFLDDDDVWRPDRLQRALDASHGVSVVVCWAGDLGSEADRPGRRLDGNVEHTILDATTPNVGATMVRAAVMVPFDESYPACEDLDWWLRLARTAELRTVPSADLRVRRHDGVRVGHGAAARIEQSGRLLREHAGYFSEHRDAWAFREKRIGVMALQSGDHKVARLHLLHSLRLRPSVGTAWRLVRTLVRAR